MNGLDSSRVRQKSPFKRASATVAVGAGVNLDFTGEMTRGFRQSVDRADNMVSSTELEEAIARQFPHGTRFC